MQASFRATLVALILFSLCKLANADDDALAVLIGAGRFNDVRAKDFDVEVSFVRGDSGDGLTRSDQHSEEYRLICRQVYESRSTKYICPFASGGLSFRLDASNNAVTDSKEAGIFYGDESSATLERVIGSDIVPQFGCSGNCLDVGCPVDFVQLVGNPFCMSLKPSARSTDAKQREHLIEYLSEANVKSDKETRNKRKVVVHSLVRLAKAPQAKHEFETITTLVVSGEGPDEGLLLEFDLTVNYVDKEKKQKRAERTQNHKIEWKQFGEGEQKVVLPVVVSKKKMYAFGKANSYVNATLNWRNFDDESRKLLDAEQSKKLAKEYDSKIDKALNR